jgi:hypothetical protein
MVSNPNAFGPSSLQKLMGPSSLQKLMGPSSLQKLMGPSSLQSLMSPSSLQSLMGPSSLQKLMGPSLQNLAGPTLSAHLAQVFSSPSLSNEAFRSFEKLGTSVTTASLVALTLDSLPEVDESTSATLESFAEVLGDASRDIHQTLINWVARIDDVPRVKLILHLSAAAAALLNFFTSPESTRDPDALTRNLLAVLLALGWLLYAVHERKQ